MMKPKSVLENKAAVYMRERRAIWAEHGFRYMTAIVHEDDRDQIMAHAGVVRWERLINALVKEDNAIIDLVCQLNRPKNLQYPDIAALELLVDDLSIDEDASQEIAATLKGIKKHTKQAAHYTQTAEWEPTNDHAHALSIAHAHMFTALLAYAQALAATAPQKGEQV